MAEHRMHVPPGQSVPSVTKVSIALDEQGARFARDQIPGSLTYQDGHGYAGNHITASAGRGGGDNNPELQQYEAADVQRRARRREQPKLAKFVATFLESNTAPPVRMLKGDYVPHVFEPARPLLPLPGAQLTASQYLFLEREERAEEHTTVPAELSPLSRTQKQARARQQQQQQAGTIAGGGGRAGSRGNYRGGSGGRGRGAAAAAAAAAAAVPANDEEAPDWRTVEHFKQWQNKAIHSTMQAAAANPDTDERDPEQDAVLQVQGVQQKPPDEELNLEELDKLVSTVLDHSAINGARGLLASTVATMEGASMQVLRDIAGDRIDRFGCQEPELVQNPLSKQNPFTHQFSDATEILSTLKKPKPPVPAANVQMKYPKLQALMERRAAEKERVAAEVAQLEADRAAAAAAEEARQAAAAAAAAAADDYTTDSGDDEVAREPVDVKDIQQLLQLQRQRQRKAARQRRGQQEVARRTMLTEN